MQLVSQARMLCKWHGLLWHINAGCRDDSRRLYSLYTVSSHLLQGLDAAPLWHKAIEFGLQEHAVQVLEKFANIQETPEGIQAGYEHSEMLLYQVSLSPDRI